jgi:hypothetical protein
VAVVAALVGAVLTALPSSAHADSSNPFDIVRADTANGETSAHSPVVSADGSTVAYVAKLPDGAATPAPSPTPTDDPTASPSPSPSATDGPNPSDPGADNIVIGAPDGDGAVLISGSVDDPGAPANGTSDSPSLSGNGRYIAFVSDATNLVDDPPTGHRDVYVAEDMGDSVQTTRVAIPDLGGTVVDVSSPSLNSEGDELAFVVDVDTPGGVVPHIIYTNPWGRDDPLEVGTFTAADQVDDVKLSADGYTLAYEYTTYASTDSQTIVDQHMVVYDVEGDDQIVDEPAQSGWGLSISDDGSAVAYVEADQVADVGTRMHGMVWHGDADLIPLPVPVDNGQSFYPAISGDGNTVSFAATDWYEFNAEIYQMSLGTGLVTRLTPRPDGEDSPLREIDPQTVVTNDDGSLVMFDSNSTNIAAGADGNRHVYSIASDVQPPSAPSTPTWPTDTYLYTEPVSTVSLVASWPAAVDDLGITAYVVSVDGSPYRTVPGSTTSLTITGLGTATHHEVSVRPADADGNVGDALTSSADTFTDLTANSAGPGQVALTWTGVDDPDVTAYSVWAAPNDSGPFAEIGRVAVGTTTYTETGVTAGKSRYYRLFYVTADNPTVAASPIASSYVPTINVGNPTWAVPRSIDGQAAEYGSTMTFGFEGDPGLNGWATFSAWSTATGELTSFNVAATETSPGNYTGSLPIDGTMSDFSTITSNLSDGTNTRSSEAKYMYLGVSGVLSVDLGASSDPIPGPQLVVDNPVQGVHYVESITLPSHVDIPVVGSGWGVSLVASDGDVVANLTGLVIGAASVVPISLTPVRHTSLVVTVAPPAGFAAGNVTVQLTDPDGTVLGSKVVAKGATTAEFDNLVAGQAVTATATLNDLTVPLQQSVFETVTLVVGRNTLTVNEKALPGAVVSGTATDDTGAIVANLFVTVQQQADGRSFAFTAMTDSSGHYSLYLLSGAATLNWSSSAYAPMSIQTEVPATGSLTSDVIVNRYAGLTLHVNAASGQASTSAMKVTITDADGNQLASQNLVDGATSLAFSRLIPNQPLTLAADLVDSALPLAAHQTLTLNLQPGSATEVTLDQRALAVGQVDGVVTTMGKPLGGAAVTVTVTQPDGSSNAGEAPRVYTTTTSSDGHFSVVTIAGTATVSVSMARYIPGSASVAVAGGSTADIAIDLVHSPKYSVTVHLFTKDSGGNEIEQNLDWTTEIHFMVTLSTPGGYYYASSVGTTQSFLGNVGDTVKFCANGSQAGLSAGCAVATLGTDYDIDLSVHLAQAAKVSANLIDTSGNAVLGDWSAVIATIGGDGSLSNAGSQTGVGGVAVGLSAAGTYRITFSVGAQRSDPITFTVGEDQALSLGDVVVSPVVGPNAPSTSIIASQDPVLPGQLEQIRVAFTAPRALAGAVIRVAIPAGATFYPESVTVNDKAASSTVVDGSAEVPLGDLAAGTPVVVRYGFDVANDATVGNLLIPVELRYGDASQYELGIAQPQVLGVTMHAPSKSSIDTAIVGGSAPAGATVTVFENGYPMTTVQAGAGGLWSATVDLQYAFRGVTYKLTARTTVDDVPLSANATIVYDDTWETPTKVTVSHYGQSQQLDPASGAGAFTMVYRPGEPVSVKADFADTSRVHDAIVWVGGNSQPATCSAGSCTASVNPSAETLGDIYFDYQVDAPAVGSAVELPTMTGEQMRHDLPWPLNAVTGQTVSDNVGGTQSITAELAGTPTVTTVTASDSQTTYTPTAADSQLQSETGVPIYNLSVNKTQDDGDSAVYHLVADVPQSWLASLPARSALRMAAAASLRPASISMEFVEHLDLFLKIQGGVKNITDAITGAYSQPYDTIDAALNRLAASNCSADLVASETEFAQGQAASVLIYQTWSLVFAAVTAPGEASLGAAAGLSKISALGLDTAVGQGLDLGVGGLQNDAVKQVVDEINARIKDCGTGTQLKTYREPVAKVRWIHDPSGFVYEGVATDVLPGVTATLEEAPSATGPWTTWNAADYGQSNPMLTNTDGHYGWDVPLGWWRVMFTKDGYSTGYSEVVQVLPQHTDMNVGLQRIAPPVLVGDANVHDGVVDVTFDTWMQVSSVTAGLTVTGQAGAAVAGTVSALDATAAPNGDMLAHSFRFTPSAALPSGVDTLHIAASAADYANVALGSEATRTFTVAGQVGKVATVLEVDRVKVPRGLFQILFGTVHPTAHLASATDGAPIAGQQVTFTMYGNTLCTALTNATGTATCRQAYSQTLAALLGGFDARYDGSADYLAAQGDGGVAR